MCKIAKESTGLVTKHTQRLHRKRDEVMCSIKVGILSLLRCSAAAVTAPGSRTVRSIEDMRSNVAVKEWDYSPNLSSRSWELIKEARFRRWPPLLGTARQRELNLNKMIPQLLIVFHCNIHQTTCQFSRSEVSRLTRGSLHDADWCRMEEGIYHQRTGDRVRILFVINQADRHIAGDTSGGRRPAKTKTMTEVSVMEDKEETINIPEPEHLLPSRLRTQSSPALVTGMQ